MREVSAKMVGSVVLVFGVCYVVSGIFWLLLKPEGSIVEQALVPEPTKT